MFSTRSIHQSIGRFSTLASAKRRGRYANLFQWNSGGEFARHLIENVVHVDKKHGLVAISKPWGVGIHSPLDSNTGRLLATQVYGEARFCIDDCLDYLSHTLEMPGLKVIKSSHRDWSGLVLLSNSPQTESRVQRSFRQAQAELQCPLKFYCITSGIIANNRQFQTERCALVLKSFEVNHKQAVYVSPDKVTKSLRKKIASSGGGELANPVKVYTVKYRTVSTNPDLAVSLVEIHCSRTKWAFLQCFLAYKAAFILGDVLYSQNVKQILGQPIVLDPLKTTNNTDNRGSNISPNFQPLSPQLQRKLTVRHNSQIPLMIHHSGITLVNFSKQFDAQNPNLILETSHHHLPAHFLDTLYTLNLTL